MRIVKTHTRPTNQELWHRVEKLRELLSEQDGEFADRLGVPLARYRSLRTRKADIPLNIVSHLTRDLNVSAEALCFGEIDYNTIAEQIKDPCYLPTRYQLGARSKMRTAVNALDYVGREFGDVWIEQPLRIFQVRPEAIANHDAPISLRFLTDLCDYYAANQLPSDEFFSIGLNITRTNAHLDFIQEIKDFDHPKRVLEFILNDQIHHFEKNFHYQIQPKANHNALQVCVKPYSETLEAMRTKVIGNSNVCITRIGAFAGLVHHAGLGLPYIDKTHCIHSGHSECRYDVSW